ncbi:MAG: 50S ribosomal protein L1 [bacterium]
MKKRSKKYIEAKGAIESGKAYPLDEAIKLVKEQSKTKFDAGVEVHMRLGVDPKKAEQIVRGTLQLPHGTGKILTVAAFVQQDQVEAIKKAGADVVGSDELIKELKKTGKANFDVAVAHPTMMKSLGPIARMLGQKGLMPNPRNETVTAKVAETVAALKKGKSSFRTDATGNLHQLIGRVSFEDSALKENYMVFTDAIKKAKPTEAKGTYIQNITLSSTMGPGIKVSF